MMSVCKVIKKARDKPVLTCLEMIRTINMNRIVNKYEAAQKYKGILCPKIEKKLQANINGTAL